MKVDMPLNKETKPNYIYIHTHTHIYNTYIKNTYIHREYIYIYIYTHTHNIYVCINMNTYSSPEGLSTLTKELTVATHIMQIFSNELNTPVSVSI